MALLSRLMLSMAPTDWALDREPVKVAGPKADAPMRERDSHEPFDVVISGASYAGLALARALATSLDGFLRLALVDRRLPQHAEGLDVRAFALSASSRRMLDVLGLWPRLAERAQAVTEIEITDSSLDAGVRPVLLTYANLLADGEPASWIVPSDALFAALLDAVAADPSITLLAPAEVTGFATTASGAELELASGDRLQAQLLVAADGRRSRLRDAAGIKIVAWNDGQTGIVTTIAHDRPHGGRAVQHFLPGGPFAMLPLKTPDGKESRSCVTWSEATTEASRILALDDEAFLAEVEKRAGGRLGTVTLAGPRQTWPLEMHLARSYVAPRFALIGDAAHGVHPIAGQGLNLALRDVAALTEVIADVVRLGLAPGDHEALLRYERWRRFDSAVSAAAFDGLNRLFSNDAALLRAARDFGLGLVDRMPGLKSFFVAEAAGETGERPRLLKGEMA
jgi:2-octaprenyl-6-methoxyphenol hydroxylase